MSDNEQTIKSKIRTYLIDEVGVENDLADDQSLFSSYMLSSIVLLNLILFVEETFSITVDIGNLSYENFDTLNLITDFICAALKNQAPAS